MPTNVCVMMTTNCEDGEEVSCYPSRVTAKLYHYSFLFHSKLEPTKKIKINKKREKEKCKYENTA